MEEESVNMIQNNFVVCPCCGKKTLPKLVDVDQATIETFMSCILAGQPFTNRYKLYSGKISVICRQPTQAETFLLSDIAANIPSIEDQKTKLSAKNLMYYIAGLFPIKQICIKGLQVGDDKVFDVRSVCLSILDELKGIPDITYNKLQQLKTLLSDPSKVGTLPNQVLSQIVGTHATVTKNLYSAGFDSAFYKGIPHVE